VKRFRISVFFTLLFLAATSSHLHAQAWQARHGLNPAQYQSVFNQFSSQGYRLKMVNGYTSGGAELYTALWQKESGPEWYSWTGMSAADYQAKFDDYAKKGFRLTWVSGYAVGSTVKFAGIWEKKSGPAWQARHNLTAGQYQQTFDALEKQGYRLVHLCGYNTGNGPLFAAIWEQSNGPAWQARHNLNAGQYQQAFNDFSKTGYRLKDVSGYNVGGTDYYAAIWEKENGTVWYARHGVPDSWYQNIFDNFYYQGYRPLVVTAFASGSGAKVNSIWENTNFSAGDLQTISSQMQQYMNANQIPGAALAITKDGRLVYAAGFGYANKETGEEAGPTSVWRIASVSKPFTSVTIMKLIEAGKLSLTDHVFGPGGILSSDYPTPASNTKINQITIKYLLEHVSGLSNTNGDPMFMNLSMNQQQLISWFLNDPGHKMTRDTNTQFEYLNFGFCLLGRVIEKKTGKHYDDYVKQMVLDPIGNTDMAIAGNAEAARKPREVKYYPPSAAYALNVTRMDSHGGWVASPIDLVRFLVHVDGLPSKPDIISANSHKLMTTDSGIKDGSGNDPNYGFGWGTPQWHNGSLDGTISFMEVLSNGYTYSVIANTRPANDFYAFNMSGAVKKIINSVSSWPSYDLF
jgi:CubicO group peptidase (beta-lactamase class C family)